MEFWELLYFTSLVTMIILFLWKFRNLWQLIDEKERFDNKQRSKKLMENFMFVILNTLAFGVSFFTFMINYDQLLLISLTTMQGIIFVMNWLFFIIEYFFSLQGKANEVIQAHNTRDKMARDFN